MTRDGLTATAARARIDRVAAAQQQRAMWALGDYHAFAKATIWSLGPILVEASGVKPGDRVLDVAAGTGNVAIRAAQAGADVVASDITPEHFEAGRREAASEGVELKWVEADAQALPFERGVFDVVTSSMGVIFAPDHARIASEMARVCRPGGTIALLAFAEGRTSSAFFDLVGRFAPAPSEDSLPPLLWGDEEHVRGLFADHAASLRFRRGRYIERSASAEAYAELFLRCFGPVIAIRSQLESGRAADFERALTDFAFDEGRADPGGGVAYHYDYALIVATRAR